MEAVIAILIVLGVLSASGVLLEKSPPTVNREANASAVKTSDPVVRPACDQHDRVYRDLTVSYEERTIDDASGKTKVACDE